MNTYIELPASRCLTHKAICFCSFFQLIMLTAHPSGLMMEANDVCLFTSSPGFTSTVAVFDHSLIVTGNLELTVAPPLDSEMHISLHLFTSVVRAFLEGWRSCVQASSTANNVLDVWMPAPYLDLPFVQTLFCVLIAHSSTHQCSQRLYHGKAVLRRPRRAPVWADSRIYLSGLHFLVPIRLLHWND